MKKANYTYFKIALLITISLSSHTYAQHGGHVENTEQDSTLMDFPTLAFNILGINKKKSNKPHKEKKFHTSILPAVGYALQTGFTADVVSNNAFLLGNKDNTNYSSLTFQVELSQRLQLTVPVNLVIWTPENKWNFTSDFRYYNYHQLNYGLGGSAPKNNPIQINYDYYRVHQTIYRKVAKYTYLGLGYNLDHRNKIRIHHSSITDEKSDFYKYNDPSKTTSSGYTLNAMYDRRTNLINPQHGEHYGNIVFRQNFKSLGSTYDWSSLFLDFRTYIALGENSKSILAFWSYNQFVLSGKPPFFDLPSTGWDAYTNVARQYRQGRYVGNGLMYLESEYRFRILKNGLINGGVFANVQTVSEFPGMQFQKYIPGGGLSLRFKMKKESNLNAIVSYGISADGSKGFFFNLGEVF